MDECDYQDHWPEKDSEMTPQEKPVEETMGDEGLWMPGTTMIVDADLAQEVLGIFDGNNLGCDCGTDEMGSCAFCRLHTFDKVGGIRPEKTKAHQMLIRDRKRLLTDMAMLGKAFELFIEWARKENLDGDWKEQFQAGYQRIMGTLSDLGALTGHDGKGVEG